MIPQMPHVIRKPGILGGTTLAVFMTLVHRANDAMTAILGALVPTTLQVRFDAGPTALALMSTHRCEHRDLAKPRRYSHTSRPLRICPNGRAVPSAPRGSAKVPSRSGRARS